MSYRINSSTKKENNDNSPLHTAAQVYDYFNLEKILKNGTNPNIITGRKQTALHLALNDGFLGQLNMNNLDSCVRILLKHGANPNLRDSEGTTPLYLAITHTFPNCVKLLLKHGADLTASNSSTDVANLALATRLSLTMPEVILEQFDEAVSYGTNDNGESQIKLDWRPVLQFRSPQKTGEEQASYYQPEKRQKESSFLYSILDGNNNTKKQLLTHPLISAFLHLKHAKVQRRLWIFYFLITIFPIVYLVFIDYLYFVRCSTDKNDTIIEGSTATTEKPEESCKINTLISVFAYFLTFIVIGWSAIEIYMLIQMDVKHLSKWRTWVTGVTLSLMMLSLWPGLQFEDLKISFQYPIAALGIFFSWVIFLLQIGSYPKFAVYIEVLVQILLTVLKIIILFLPLLIGFYMGFSLMFTKTSSVFRFIMMIFDIGAADYEEILDRPRDDNDYGWYKLVTYAFCVSFIVIITVVFMNFVLGSAINDIQKLKYEAKISYVTRSVENLLTTDLLVPGCRLVSPEQLGRGELYYEFSPINRKSTLYNLPRDIQTSLIAIINKRNVEEKERNTDTADGKENNTLEIDGKASEVLQSLHVHNFNKKLMKLEQKLNEMTTKLDSLIP